MIASMQREGTGFMVRKQWGAALLVVVLFCGGAAYGLEPFQLISGENLGLDIGGWTQLGYHSEDSVPDLFNQNSGGFNLHQQWFYVERTADGSDGWDIGFRFDAMYGIDADNTQSFGNNPGNWDIGPGFSHGDYGWALPQAYVDLAYGDLSITAGHFYTLVGYEVVTAPDNFFYSHAYTMNNSEPFTHTGVLATYSASDRLTLYGGWTAGWDTGFDRMGDGSSFLGGASLALTENVAFTYITTFGDLGWAGDEAYSHSIVIDMALTENLNYVLQSDVMELGEMNVSTIGINQYLLYSLNDRWGVGARVEWWKADGTSINGATFGANWTPHPNLIVRPEIRQEWSHGLAIDETSIGIDTILTY
jgi:hypothetical protein